MDVTAKIKERMNTEQLIRVLGSVIAIAALGVMYYFYDLPLLIASFGSSAVTLFALPNAPAARPKNVILGQFSSAVCGWVAQYLLGSTWYGAAVAVACSLIVMVLLDCVHPPGGATALTAVISPQQWTFIFAPVAIGAIFLVLISIVTERCIRHYKDRKAEDDSSDGQ